MGQKLTDLYWEQAFNVGDRVRPEHKMALGGYGGAAHLSPREAYTVEALGSKGTRLRFKEVGNQYGWWDRDQFRMVKMVPATTEQVRLVCTKILELVSRYKEHPYKINQGICEDFALDLKSALERVEIFGYLRGIADSDRYPCHFWYEFKGRHFDAEEPYGQRRWQDLPIFHRARCHAKDEELGRLFPAR